MSRHTPAGSGALARGSHRICDEASRSQLPGPSESMNAVALRSRLYPDLARALRRAGVALGLTPIAQIIAVA